MAIVSAEVRFAPQLTAWFTANPTKVLQDGEIVYCSDGANVGKYVIGDNSTQLSALTFYGGLSSSGLTIGTTTITSGTNTRILYNNNGVLGEYAVTGTGTTAVLSTSPTFTTDITTPLIIGGTAVGSTITYKGTSGVGTSTVAAHQFLVGNNGATIAGSIYNNGNWNIGNAVTTNQRLFRIGQDTAIIDFGSLVVGTTNAAIYLNQSSPALSNAALWGSSASTSLNVAAGGDIGIKFGNTTLVQMYGTLTGGNTPNFVVTLPAMNTITASANSPSVKITGSTKQWATGALATQYFNYFSANTVSFVGASTATNVYGLYVEAATAGTNATITNNWAIGANGGLYVKGISGYFVNFLNSASNSGFRISNATLQAEFYSGSTISTPAVTFNSATTYGLSYNSSQVGLVTNGVSVFTFGNSVVTLADAYNIALNGTTGTKIGTATTQKLSFWNATPIVQPTTAGAASTLTSNGGTTLTSTDTIDGYTLLQVVKALRNTGLLA